MAGCAFCRIAENGPAWALAHGDDVISFKPFGAVTPMHRMFVPREHVEGAGDDPLVTARCFEEAARWAKGKGRPFNLVVNSGAEADQGVFHLHVHYVPRTADDGLGYRWEA